ETSEIGTALRQRRRGGGGGVPGIGGGNGRGNDGGNGRHSDDPDLMLEALIALRDGDFEYRLGRASDNRFEGLFEVFNQAADLRAGLTEEIVRVARTVGREGLLGERVSLVGARGGWATSVDALNALITDVLQPTTEVARVLTSVAEGDLSAKMALDISGRSVQGEFLRIGTTVNRMVDQLSAFAS